MLERLQELNGIETLLIAGLPDLLQASSEVELQAASLRGLKQIENQAKRVSDNGFN
jgi:hypothetical protein